MKIIRKITKTYNKKLRVYMMKMKEEGNDHFTLASGLKYSSFGMITSKLSYWFTGGSSKTGFSYVDSSLTVFVLLVLGGSESVLQDLLLHGTRCRKKMEKHNEENG